MQRYVYLRLSVMMFIQYAIWGAWAPILFLHLSGLSDFTGGHQFFETGTLINFVYMTMALASMVAPLAGQMADRYFPTQYFLAVSHLVGGLLLFWVAQVDTFIGIFFVLLLHCLLYAPTVGLTNSIALSHLPRGEQDFGKVRLWGTIGWIVVSWVFGIWLGLMDPLIEAIDPAWKQALANWRSAQPSELFRVRQCLNLAGILSIVLAVFCVLLPHTPPSREARNPFAFLGAFKLMSKPAFAVLMVVSFLVSTELQFYYVLTPGFFNQSGGPFDAKQIAGDVFKDKGDEALPMSEDLVQNGDKNGDKQLSRKELSDLNNDNSKAVLAHYDKIQDQKGGLMLDKAWVGPVLTFGQIAETLILLMFPLSLRYLGFRYTIAIGILAWSIRYFIFSLVDVQAIVIASQTLHGFGFGFFFVGAFVYGNMIAGKDIRASVQSFIIFLTYGAGMVVSSLIAGPIADYFKGNWHYIFLVPAVITLFCTIVFVLGFRDNRIPGDKAEELAKEEFGQSDPEVPPTDIREPRPYES